MKKSNHLIAVHRRFESLLADLSGEIDVDGGYRFRIGEDAEGVLYINPIDRLQRGCLTSFPAVGLRQRKIQHLYHQLLPSFPELCVSPIVVERLCYLGDFPTYKTWKICAEPSGHDELNEVIAKFREVGLPFLRKVSSLDGLLEMALHAARNDPAAASLSVNADFLVPAIYLLRGEITQAKAYWQREVSVLRTVLEQADYMEYQRSLAQIH